MDQLFKCRHGVFILIGLLFITNVIASSGQRRGTAGAQELLIPVGSRGTALNGAFTAGIDGIEAIYWNPAGLVGNAHSLQAMFSHQNYLADMTIDYGAVAADLGDIGNIGISIKSFDFGAEIAETTIENPDGTGRKFSPIFLTFGLTYARQMTERLRFGTTLKIVSENIINAQAIGYAFDFGVQYASGWGGLQFGLTLKNFGPRMAFSGPELEHQVQIPGTEAGTDMERLRIKSAAFDLPAQFELGVSYLFDVDEKNAVTVMGAYQNNSFSFDTYNLAAEYVFSGWVFLRASYTLALTEDIDGSTGGFTSSSEDYLYGPAFGAGIQLGLGNQSVMSLDYAYRTTAVFDGGTQWFSITFGL